MNTTDTTTMAGWRGREVTDQSGEKIGRLEEIYLDDQTGQPEWVAVKTGLFGGHVSLVPLQGVTENGGELQVAFARDKVKGAPPFDLDGHLELNEEDTLYEYYGL